MRARACVRVFGGAYCMAPLGCQSDAKKAQPQRPPWLSGMLRVSKGGIVWWFCSAFCVLVQMTQRDASFFDGLRFSHPAYVLVCLCEGKGRKYVCQRLKNIWF